MRLQTGSRLDRVGATSPIRWCARAPMTTTARASGAGGADRPAPTASESSPTSPTSPATDEAQGWPDAYADDERASIQAENENTNGESRWTM